MKHGRRVRCFALIAILMSLTVSMAKANIITFSGLGGANGDPVTTYTEGQFTVTVTLGSWFQGQIYGNPVPSIYDGPIFSLSDATIQITDSVGLFSYASFDYSSNNGASNYSLTGSLGGVPLWSQGGTLVASLPPGFGFNTSSVGVSTLIDTLSIEVLPGSGVTSINLDNINLPTPEPSSLVLLGTGVLGLLGAARRKGVS